MERRNLSRKELARIAQEGKLREIAQRIVSAESVSGGGEYYATLSRFGTDGASEERARKKRLDWAAEQLQAYGLIDFKKFRTAEQRRNAADKLIEPFRQQRSQTEIGIWDARSQA